MRLSNANQILSLCSLSNLPISALLCMCFSAVTFAQPMPVISSDSSLQMQSSSLGMSDGGAEDAAPSNAPAFVLTEAEIRRIMQQAIENFYTPGISVAIVHAGKLVFSGGEGLRNIEQALGADQDTYYRLASTSKAFTSAALGILVDQGKLNWQDRVIDHLPYFQMQDPWVTREFTVQDLLTHRSGLVSAAGDSMIWPEPSGFSREEVINNLRFLTPQYSFRSQYAYSNVLYITAGELVAKISEQAFEQFVDEHVFKALDMDCFAGNMPANKLDNVAMAYAHNDTKGLYAVPRNAIHGTTQMSAAAGGMVCSVNQMSKWLLALLGHSELPFSQSQLSQMWGSQTILGISDIDQEWDGTLFKTYGLGWRLSNLYEYKMVSHTGTLSGYQAYVTLVPEFDLGVVVLNNGSNYGARGAVMQSIIKAVLAVHKGEKVAQDWIQTYVDYQAKREAQYIARNVKEPAGSGKVIISKRDILGTYKDRWFGDFAVFTDPDNKRKIRIQHNKMSTLTGNFIAFHGTSYKVEWDNSNAQADAFLHFETNQSGKVSGFKMHPFTSEERQNHEYLDMHFIKQLIE